jgi:hypothetical protein
VVRPGDDVPQTEHGEAVQRGTLARLFSLNELALATLLVLGLLALHGHVLAAVWFVWYSALFVLRQ